MLADIVFGACGPAWRFLGTRLDVDLCRRHEQRLVGAYNDELLRQRATGYSAKRRFNDYRLGQFQARTITALGCMYSPGPLTNSSMCTSVNL
ncbi:MULTISPECIES: hypothetical protein [Mycolicibacterium]|jgi:hypothetical protein|uniref:Aminoglycoside phosphotransferase n=3 Tax=Mycolicibacterium TaxID=1866885 RepID=A0A378U549_MYCFO|nr:hypothetical protein [Mycolicibacterium fortuitum]MCV7142538.1 hypothetical protein [Mycolicibacterium fortuitum]MDV7195663.1 hypothetical protein [Mycolicibacterium fortuitum]MDV7209357.1 hypothetical protein [Mycolicibacterium fortuitum]MDV7231195.1 hypothetical protein [Mycolicibacterium fortuitum]MDV7262763.1 hypothetical protein [Mycolicibacterium fortuitum]